jgi:hypothetical protein
VSDQDKYDGLSQSVASLCALITPPGNDCNEERLRRWVKYYTSELSVTSHICHQQRNLERGKSSLTANLSRTIYFELVCQLRTMSTGHVQLLSRDFQSFVVSDMCHLGMKRAEPLIVGNPTRCTLFSCLSCMAHAGVFPQKHVVKLELVASTFVTSLHRNSGIWRNLKGKLLVRPKSVFTDHRRDA